MKYLIALVILLSINFIASTANAAPHNGHFFIYHRSDCGEGEVRIYNDGGRGPGGPCGAWTFTKFEAQVVHSERDHNFTLGELDCMKSQLNTQQFNTTYTISDNELRGCGLDVLINSPGFQELRKKKVRGNELRDN
jgi:hypothetical protein